MQLLPFPCTKQILTLVLAWLAAGAVWGRQCIEVTLPAGDDRVEKRFKVLEFTDNVTEWQVKAPLRGDDRWALGLQPIEGCVSFTAEGNDPKPSQIGIVAVHRLLGEYPELIQMEVDGIPTGHIYNRVTMRSLERPSLTLRYNTAVQVDAEQSTSEFLDSVQLILVIEHLQGRCALSATVSGDVRGHYVGDVAYFNAHETAIREGFAAGSISDPESIEMMADFIDSMTAMAQAVEESGIDSGAEGSATMQGGFAFREFAKRELAPEPGETGDNFGLSLTDVKQGKLNAAQDPVAMLSSAFTLTVSGNISSAVETGAGPGFDVTPSTVVAKVGLSTGGGSVPFELNEQGNVRVTLIPQGSSGSDYVFGTLKGNLNTENHYSIPGVADDELLSIDIDATFTARRGAFGCMH